MKILVDPDSVPSNLEECLVNIKRYLDVSDVEELQDYGKNPFWKEKAGAATFLENAWSLTDKESKLVQWFKKTYNFDSATFISALILDCLYHDIRGTPRQDKELAVKIVEALTPKEKKEVKSE